MIEHLFEMIGYDYKNKREKDRVLLEEFLHILPSDSVAIETLRQKDMGDWISIECFKSIDIIADLWDSSDKEFQVKKLERLKLNLIDKLNYLSNLYAQRSGPAGNNCLSIGMKDYEDRDEMWEYKEQLNIAARDAYKSYDKFIRAARSEI